MTLPSNEIILQLKDKGLSWADIGQKFGVSRQRVQAKVTGYTTHYQKTEHFLTYRRHQMHDENTKLRKPCNLCKM